MTHQWAQPASQLGDDRGLSEDQSPGAAPAGKRRMRKPGFAYSVAEIVS